MSWTPENSPQWESLSTWHAPYDPEGYGYSDGIMPRRQATMLLKASPTAFGAVERQLSATAQLAAVTAQGLRAANGADWHGEAADNYRHALGKLPTTLDQVHQSYLDALSAIAAFSQTTFDLQSRYKTFQGNLSSLRNTWGSALIQTYSDEASGMAHLNTIKNELTTLCAHGHSILNASDEALSTLISRLTPLEQAAPHVHVSTWQKIVKPFKDFLNTITGTWGAFQNYWNHPGWETLGKLTESLAVDASIVVLAAGAPEGLAGLGIIDAGADSAVLTGAEYTAAAARGVSVAATGLNVTSAEFQGDYGTGALAALALLVPGAKEAFGTNELDATIGEAKIVAAYKAERDAGGSVQQALGKLTPDEQKALKAAVPDYANPSAVTAATKRIGTELQSVRKNVGLVDAPKGFVWENGVLVPAVKAAGQGTNQALGVHPKGSGEGG